MLSKPKVAIVARVGLCLALAWFSWLMLRITLGYYPLRDDAGFLQIKQQYLAIDHWRMAFWIHVFTSMFALLAGFTQFFPAILRKAPHVHRWMGKLYVLNVCFVTGPASLVMAFYANGGWTSRLAFILLALGWILTTTAAWRYACQRKWMAHQEWMMRSYALTLSALTLRAWKVTLVLFFEPRPMDLYRIVAWLGFIPNLLIAEWLIRRWRAARKPPEPGTPSSNVAKGTDHSL
ncbi:putative membrane protein DUF2306 [Prosthecobacter fusiformis]|uniref:Putative membrane protein DUF2306 n=1 Tax=Prosthecobacter fusiformis TaxID=48464 RepID=A0A4R7RMC0_9BACT|nr:DUF2306 domain-containing protein [Prosthecobacter fusiformis]TDU66514.1 putative membrane protein DUF2306 [Prosthecobacter fusiformis]